MEKRELVVGGMTCGHCVVAIRRELLALAGIGGVSVDLVPGGESTVWVTGVALPTADAMRRAVEAAGYRVV